MHRHFFQISILAFCGMLGPLSAQEPDLGPPLPEKMKSRAGLDVATVQEFDQLDRDRNGVLDEFEFAFSQIAQRARETGGGARKVKQIFEKVDRDADSGVGLMELAHSQHNRNAHLLDRASGRKYAGFDEDQDGLIGLKEYLGREGSKAQVFQGIDLNRSERVGPFEWVQALREEFMSNEDAPKFAVLDPNDDGAIDREEFINGTPPAAIANAFAAIDLNGNQEIGPREFGKALVLPVGEQGVGPGDVERFEWLDRNRDQAISRREFSKSRPGMRAPNERIVDDIFAQIDLNDDGELSLVEFSKRHRKPGPPPFPPPPPPGKSKG